MCGLFGFVYYGKKEFKNAEKLLQKLAWESAVRGIDATGYAYIHKGKIQIEKAPKPAYTMKYLLPKKVRTVMGHTRAATQGNAKLNFNNHPFKGKLSKGEFAFAHNGVIDNEFELREEFDLKHTKIQTDSYVVCQLMEKLGYFSKDNLRTVGEEVEGMFTFTFLDDKENLYIVKNDSPLTILHFPTLELYVYASTDDIIFNALCEFKETKNLLIKTVKGEHGLIENIPVVAGDILIIQPNGQIERGVFEPKERFWYNPRYYAICNGYINTNSENISKDESENEVKDDDYEFYKEMVLKEANQMGITDKEFNKLLEFFSLEEIDDFLYTGEIYEVMLEYGI